MSDFKEFSDIEPDLSYLNEVSGGSAEFIVDMINVFLEQTPIYFTELNQAVEKEDWKTTSEVAHKIKPTLVFMGVDKAKSAMEEIERKARQLDSVEDIKAELDKINLLCVHLYAKLEERKVELEKSL